MLIQVGTHIINLALVTNINLATLEDPQVQVFFSNGQMVCFSGSEAQDLQAALQAPTVEERIVREEIAERALVPFLEDSSSHGLVTHSTDGEGILRELEAQDEADRASTELRASGGNV